MLTVQDVKHIRRTLRTVGNRLRCELNRISAYTPACEADADKASSAADRIIGLLQVVEPMADIVEYIATGNENCHAARVVNAFDTMNAAYSRSDGTCLFPTLAMTDAELENWADDYAQVADAFDYVNDIVSHDDGIAPHERIPAMVASAPARREQPSPIELLRRQSRSRSSDHRASHNRQAAAERKMGHLPLDEVTSGWRL